jgi:hypothetical protein
MAGAVRIGDGQRTTAAADHRLTRALDPLEWKAVAGAHDEHARARVDGQPID